MRQIICINPLNFEYSDVAVPQNTAGNALLKIKRVGVCGTDLHAFEGTQPYFSYPRILGHEIAAEIVEIDQNSEFEVGQRVTIIPYFNCGICIACRQGKPNCCSKIQVFGVHIDGGMAEYVSVPAYSLVQSQGLDFDELALIEPLAIGAHSIKRAEIKPEDVVLVIGAGPIGLGIIAFAKLAGAKVIVMDVNQERLNFCKKSLGVDFLINPQNDNVGKIISELTEGDMASVVIDATGNLAAINNAFQYMAHGGKFVLVGLQKGDISVNHPEFHKREATLMSSRNATRADFEYVISCIKNGSIKPLDFITHRVHFEDVKANFESFSVPSNNVIKAMISFN